jgi:SH3-like domain-containing protein
MVRHALVALLFALPLSAVAQTAHRPEDTKHKPAHKAEHHHPVHHPAHPAKPPAKPTPVVRTPASPAHVAPHPPPHPAVVPAPTPAPAPDPAPAEPAKGSNTGLPLPRFAALKTDEVNLRSGPGLRYPIEWVFKRRDLPVEIQREFEVWRLVSDSEGTKGWVHQATLIGRRSFVVTGTEQTMRADAQDTARAVAILKPGVIGRLRSCEAAAAWCQVQVADYHGWLKRDAFWGIYPGEAVQ